jgi:heavy metal sensor kinase
MTPRSIRFRLTAWYTGVLAATLALTGVAAWFGIRAAIHDTVDDDLRARAGEVRERVMKEVASPAFRGYEAEIEDFLEEAGGAQLRITGPTGATLCDSTQGRGWPAPPPDPARLRESGATRTVWLHHHLPLRRIAAPIRAGGGLLVLELATPIDEYYEMLSAFGLTAWLAAPVLLALASLGGWWMSGRALAPVDRITRTAASIGARNLGERLPLSGSGDELDRLSGTLNAMLARLDCAFRRVTQFTADASHELRTPVSILRTTAELALSKPRANAEYVKALEGVLRESERATGLIEDLMTLARADAGATPLEREPLELSGLLHDLAEESRVLADAARVRLSTHLPPDCPFAGDPQALRRLFLILLDNAVKYTPAGGEVHLTLSRTADAAVVEVRDTGAGIAPEDLPHIFERFYRAAKDRSRSTGGAGLGLSIAQWIAARHNGKIETESELGRGSVFRVTLRNGECTRQAGSSS